MNWLWKLLGCVGIRDWESTGTNGFYMINEQRSTDGKWRHKFSPSDFGPVGSAGKWRDGPHPNGPAAKGNAQ